MAIRIRKAALADRAHIAEIYRHAFAENEQDLIADLAVDLLVEQTRPLTISLLADSGTVAVGHIAFSPVTIDRHDDLRASILAPLAVKPNIQKQGVGSLLVQSGITMLGDAGVHIVFVYGDPAYYGRFGFRTGTAEQFRPPHELQYPLGWQAVILSPATPEKLSGTIACVSALDDPRLW
jgi:putative acetyltransferase